MATFGGFLTSLHWSAETVLLLLGQQQQKNHPYHKSELPLFVFIFLKTFYEQFHT